MTHFFLRLRQIVMAAIIASIGSLICIGPVCCVVSKGSEPLFWKELESSRGTLIAFILCFTVVVFVTIIAQPGSDSAPDDDDNYHERQRLSRLRETVEINRAAGLSMTNGMDAMGNPPGFNNNE